MSDETPKLRSEDSTYGIIYRLGLKYISRGYARPKFATGSLVGNLSNSMFDVFDNFRQLQIDRLDARQELLNLVAEYGPKIWGTNRAHVVAFPDPKYPEHTKDLHWSDGPKVQRLY